MTRRPNRGGSLGHRLATVALGPILLLQGRRVRRRVPRLPEAPGARAGIAGRGPPLRLLIAGDSAGAGVGAPSQEEALSGRLVKELTRDFRVRWQVEARTGATTADTLARLEALEPASFDVLVTSLGVNDITRNVGLPDWLRQQEALLRIARDRLGVSLSVVAGLPPVDGFPALPQPLRWYLGRRAREFTRHLERFLAGVPDAHVLDLRFTRDASLMAEDGFHPGPVIYAGWAERAAGIIRSSFAPADGPATARET